jgi:hypothetical protein
MIIRNKIEKPFGPFGTSAGFFLFLGGIGATFFSLFGILIAVVGAFIAFTSISAFIDVPNKKVKLSNDLFGFIPVGKWIDFKSDMKLGIKKTHRGYVGYIRGNQPMGIHNYDVRIILYSSDNNQIMPVKKFDSLESAREELHIFASQLGLMIL